MGLIHDNDLQIEHIIRKYAGREDLSEHDQAVLDEWRSRSPAHADMVEKFRDEEWVRESLTRLHNIPSPKIWAAIEERLDKQRNAAWSWSGTIRKFRDIFKKGKRP